MCYGLTANNVTKEAMKCVHILKQYCAAPIFLGLTGIAIFVAIDFQNLHHLTGGPKSNTMMRTITLKKRPIMLI